MQIQQSIREYIATGAFHAHRREVLQWKEDHWSDAEVLSQIANFFEQHQRVCTECEEDVLQADYELAAEIYERVLELNESSQPAMLFFAKQWFGKPGPEFENAIEEMIEKTGQKGCYTYLGHHYQAQEDYEKAKSNFLKAEPYIQDHYGIYYALAKLSEIQGNKKECAMWAEKALEIFEQMKGSYKDDPITEKFIDELKGWVKE